MLSRSVIRCGTSFRSASLEVRRLNSTANDNPHAPLNVPVPLKQEEGFREMFLMPKRKLQAQIAIERITGRAEQQKMVLRDINDRITVRRPRREDMRTDQDWTSVWPAAASFRSSVVPLPIRMGTRRHVDRRAPFKTIGNLELMKIPNFLHLTSKHIQKHCDAIKSGFMPHLLNSYEVLEFFTKFPPELTPEVASRYMPLTYTYSDYVHQGTSIRDMRARVVTVKVNLDAFGLPTDDGGHARDKLRHLLGSRYDAATNTFTITADRCMTRKQNRDYIEYLLTALYHESCKREAWEESREYIDNLWLEYDGSQTKRNVAEVLTRLKEGDTSTNASVSEATQKIEKFKEAWTKYRNNLEHLQRLANTHYKN